MCVCCEGQQWMCVAGAADCLCSLYTPEVQTQSQGEKKKMRNVTQSEAICHFSLLKGAILRLRLLGLALV